MLIVGIQWLIMRPSGPVQELYGLRLRLYVSMQGHKISTLDSKKKEYSEMLIDAHTLRANSVSSLSSREM